MNVFKLKDGLGNQLFQYGASKMLEKRHGPLAYDISFYQSDYNLQGQEFNTRDFLLPYFVDDIQITDIGDRPCVVEWQYDPGKDYDNVYFFGDWQKVSYFKDLKLNIRLKDKYITDEMRTIAKELKSCNSVAVHVRRTDYGVFNWFLDYAYYHKAEQYILKEVENPVFYIFADDIDYVKMYPPVGSRKKYIHTDQIGDFWLMSQCKHQIIANSTYSFWAGYLNENPNKLVVYPFDWIIGLRPINCILPSFKGV